MKIIKILVLLLPKKQHFWRIDFLSLFLFLGMMISLLIAYPIYATTGEILTKSNAYAIGLLISLTVALSIYLFWVIFQPERF